RRRTGSPRRGRSTDVRDLFVSRPEGRLRQAGSARLRTRRRRERDPGLSAHRLRASRASEECRRRGNTAAPRGAGHGRAAGHRGPADSFLSVMLRTLIVNAGDFGLTRAVSRGILTAHRHGIVTSSTVLVTAAVEPDLLAEARDQGLALGLHVNVTLGKPLT